MNAGKTYALSEAAYQKKLEYIASYNKKMARLTIQIEPNEKEHIKALASERDMSVKELILIAIRRFEEE